MARNLFDKIDRAVGESWVAFERPLARHTFLTTFPLLDISR